MPELPEIEIVKRSLLKMINKAKIVNIKINNKNLRYKISPRFRKNLIGEKILGITRSVYLPRMQQNIKIQRWLTDAYYSKASADRRNTDRATRNQDAISLAEQHQ